MGRVIISCGPGGEGCIFVAQSVRVPSPCHIPAWLCVQAHASALPCWFLLYKGPGFWEAWTSCLFAPAQGRPLPRNAALITFLGYLHVAPIPQVVSLILPCPEKKTWWRKRLCCISFPHCDNLSPTCQWLPSIRMGFLWERAVSHLWVHKPYVRTACTA